MNLDYIRGLAKKIKEIDPSLTALDHLKKRHAIIAYLDSFDGTHIADGCYFKTDEIICVLINPNLSEYDRNWVFAHEFGHFLLHTDLNIFFVEKYDKVLGKKLDIEADTFCAEFLLDDDIFIRYEGVPTEDIARIVGVPHRFVVMKYNNLCKVGLIDAM